MGIREAPVGCATPRTFFAGGPDFRSRYERLPLPASEEAPEVARAPRVPAARSA